MNFLHTDYMNKKLTITSRMSPRGLRRQAIGMSLVILGLLVPALPCMAGDSGSWFNGYAFVAPGIRTHEEMISGITHFGGGGEIGISKNISIGAEMGYLRPWKDTHEDIGLFSLSGAYHFRRSGRWVPFAFAGFSLAFWDHTLALHRGDPPSVNETLKLLNFGFGTTYWLRGRKGLRFELRNHIYGAETDRHYMEARFAFIFH
jgi:hypothetical protein